MRTIARDSDDQTLCLAIIPFDPQTFGSAANNGQMIAEMSSSNRNAEIFLQLAQLLTGRSEVKRTKGGLLTPLLAKLMKK